MFCAKCQNDLVDCVCSDIDERLKRLLENPLTQLAGGMNILARQAKQAEKRLAEAEELLERCKRGYVNLIELNLLPHLGYEYSALAMSEEIEAFLRKGGE